VLNHLCTTLYYNNGLFLILYVYGWGTLFLTTACSGFFDQIYPSFHILFPFPFVDSSQPNDMYINCKCSYDFYPFFVIGKIWVSCTLKGYRTCHSLRSIYSFQRIQHRLYRITLTQACCNVSICLSAHRVQFLSTLGNPLSIYLTGIGLVYQFTLFHYCIILFDNTLVSQKKFPVYVPDSRTHSVWFLNFCFQ
jgi:hypothetical protein